MFLISVQDLYVYPIKSCGGIRVDSVCVKPWGFEYDHVFMLVDEKGNHLSQRELPKMCLVETSFYNGGLLVGARGKTDSQFLSFAGVSNELLTEVTVHGNLMKAYDQRDAPALWFSRFLDFPCRLVRAHKNYLRTKECSVLGSALTSTISLKFQDSSPIHLLTEASLRNLSEQCGVADVNRFRPNIVLSGERLKPYAEDDWANLLVDCSRGMVRLTTRKKTERCGIPGINQQTAMKEKQPLQALAQSRRGEDGKTVFGTYLIPTAFSDLTIIRCGDKVRAESVA